MNADRLFHEYPAPIQLQFFSLSCRFKIRILTYFILLDTVIEFSWEPRGERFAIISSSDPNLGNPGPGVTIKTDVSFYQLEKGKGDFKLLSMYCFYLLWVFKYSSPFIHFD